MKSLHDLAHVVQVTLPKVNFLTGVGSPAETRTPR